MASLTDVDSNEKAADHKRTPFVWLRAEYHFLFKSLQIKNPPIYSTKAKN